MWNYALSGYAKTGRKGNCARGEFSGYQMLPPWYYKLHKLKIGFKELFLYTNEYITCLDFDKSFYRNKQFPCECLYIVFNVAVYISRSYKDLCQNCFLQITLTKVLFL